MDHVYHNFNILVDAEAKVVKAAFAVRFCVCVCCFFLL